MSVINRMLEIVDYKGISKRKFYDETGLSNGYLDKEREVGHKKMEIICSVYPEISPVWLLLGKGAMFIEEKNTPVVQFPSKSIEKLQDSQQIPLYDVMATASVVSLFKDPSSLEILDTIHIPNMPTCDGAVAITGDSMYPLIKSGDLVLYKTIEDKRNSVLYGNMYLVGVNIEGDEMLMVKYLHKSNNNDYIKLVSENKHHGDVEIHLDNIISLALIKGNVRYNFIK